MSWFLSIVFEGTFSGDKMLFFASVVFVSVICIGNSMICSDKYHE